MQPTMAETTPENISDDKNRVPTSDSADSLQAVKKESQSWTDDVKSSIQPRSTRFDPYRGAGLLDRIAGFDRLFPEDSAREGDFAARQDDRDWRTPKTIKVKARGAGTGRIGHVKQNEVGSRDRQDEPWTLHEREEMGTDSRTTGAMHNGIVVDGQPRKIQLRRNLRAWSSVDGGANDSRPYRPSPYKRVPDSKRGSNKSDRDNDRIEQDTSNATPGIAHQACPHFAPVYLPTFAPSSN